MIGGLGGIGLGWSAVLRDGVLRVLGTRLTGRIDKYCLARHLLGRMRHRVSELTEDESTHEQENYTPTMESSMTHESEINCAVSQAQPKIGREAERRHQTLEWTPELVRDSF